MISVVDLENITQSRVNQDAFIARFYLKHFLVFVCRKSPRYERHQTLLPVRAIAEALKVTQETQNEATGQPFGFQK